MNRLAPIAAFAAALALPAQAEPAADGLWRGSLALGLSYSAGNTDSSTFSLAADAARITATDKFSASATARHGRSKSGAATTRTAELFKAAGRYDRDISARHFWFGGLGLEHDGLQDLELRTTVNGGLGRHVVRGRDTTFDVFAGAGATRERFETLSRDFAEVVLGEESSHRLSEGTTLKQRLAIYPNLEDSGEYRADFDATLATAIASGWTFNVTLSSRYVSNPLPGLESTDTVLLLGIASKFGPR